MGLLEIIKSNFTKGYIDKAMSIEGLPTELPAWTVKRDHWIGVAIPLPQEIDFSETFANVKLYVEKKAEISGNEYTLLILRCDAPDLRDEFSTICYHFVDPGNQGCNRKSLLNNPEDWWNKWKRLLGNRDKEAEAYSLLGELLTLVFLQKRGLSPKWLGSQGSVQDIQTDNCNYEVKSTTKRYGYEVTINSIYQLKNKDHELKLVFCRFEKSEVGLDLNSVIASLVSLGYSEVVLEERMKSIGLERGCTARKKKYRLIEMKMYRIDDSFPAITEKSFKGDVIPKSILRINYSVDLSGLLCENILETEQSK